MCVCVWEGGEEQFVEVDDPIGMVINMWGKDHYYTQVSSTVELVLVSTLVNHQFAATAQQEIYQKKRLTE